MTQKEKDDLIKSLKEKLEEYDLQIREYQLAFKKSAGTSVKLKSFIEKVGNLTVKKKCIEQRLERLASRTLDQGIIDNHKAYVKSTRICSNKVTQ